MSGRVKVYVPPKIGVNSIPERWSFSSIRAFYLCPLRWVLRDTETKPVSSLATIEGELLHQLLHAYFSRNKAEKFLQRRTLIDLISAYSDNLDDLATKSLLLRISIQEVLFNFAKALHAVNVAGVKDYVSAKIKLSAGNQSASIPAPKSVSGVEKWLEDASLSLCGRLDFYIEGALIDFKSGARHDWHDDQVRFYCALIHSQSGAVPTSARIYYTNPSLSVDVTVPTPSECASLLLKYQELASAAKSMLLSGQVSPQPDREYCTFCPNKALCDAYWEKIMPEVLEDVNLNVADVSAEGKGSVLQTDAYAKVTFTIGSGDVEILFPRHTHRDLFEKEYDLRKCRVLKARKRDGTGSLFLVLTEQSEVFVQDTKQIEQPENMTDE